MLAHVTQASLGGAAQAESPGQPTTGHLPGGNNPASVPGRACQPKAQALFVFLTGITKPPEQPFSPAKAGPVKEALCDGGRGARAHAGARNRDPDHL